MTHPRKSATPPASHLYLRHRRSKRSSATLTGPIRVSLWGNPDTIDRSPFWTRVMAIAQRYFDANPDHQFCWVEVTHAELAYLNERGLFTGSVEHPRSHAWNSHMYAEIAGPGPHSLLFYRDWRSQSPWLSDADREAGLPQPGVMILPNVDRSAWGQTPAQQQWAGELWWTAWENSTGTGKTAAEIIIQTMLALTPPDVLDQIKASDQSATGNGL